MTRSLPDRIAGRLDPEGAVAAVAAEVIQEKAEALADTKRKLKERLAALAEATDDTERAQALRAAADAAYGFVIQRELCGLRDSDGALAQLGAPRAVIVRMGVR
ncbi:DUF6665 family protein [Stakelama tenebrarum]|uniref:Uncharacterized protein n=1 Tax=Stakelama tenebrarum TaxID=2711215 RepID=A0A6G6Y9B3_9SPHN|nr:DUF6665 family protein [Sphingosinithalassobacter tenebrarum]QIG81509.1 hypothetical protein G5C33_18105 [Sphingosinithalassobacter tenebrarum]